jgi:hypothetical protein
LEQEGRIISKEFGRYSGGNVVYRPLRLSPEELQQGYWNLYEKLFTWRAIYWRAGHNLAGLWPFMRGIIMAVNLHYRYHISQRICPGIV